MDALERLSQWVSKYKTFELRDGGINPGNEASITLKNGYRKVTVDEWDFQPKLTEEEKDDIEANWKTKDYPSWIVVPYSDLINRALDLWESDDKPKVYQVFCRAKKSGAWEGLTWKENEYVFIRIVSQSETSAMEFMVKECSEKDLGLDIYAITEKGYATQEDLMKIIKSDG